MKKRIVIAELKQETSTFNPARTCYSDFRITFGTDILDAYRGTETELAGALDVLENNHEYEIVATMAADAVSGGPIAKADLDRLMHEFVTAVERASPADAAYISFHGAMAGEAEGDPEGRILTDIRRMLGSVPIVVSLDLHAVISERLMQGADILVPFHTYPHTDQYQTGKRSGRLLQVLLEDGIQPTTARIQLPMLVRGDELLTATGRFGEAIRMCQEIEASAGGLAAGVIIGNAFTDVPDLQSNVIVTTDNDLSRAEREADRIARFMWENRKRFQAQLTPLPQAIQQACRCDGLVVFSDAADATASGAPGDSNAILKGLLDAEFSKAALLSMVDVPAVEFALEIGIGAEITVSIGGSRDPNRFQPVEILVRVRSLHDGDFTYENGTAGRAGRAAVLVSNNYSILVTERPIYIVGLRAFQAFGLEPSDFDLVVVKSPNGFRTWYESMTSLIVPVDVPGSTSANLKSLPFKNCVRPIFPLDENVPDPFGV